ncbi:MAG: DM13 domain-containing protein [Bacteroidota bacterium]
MRILLAPLALLAVPLVGCGTDTEPAADPPPAVATTPSSPDEMEAAMPTEPMADAEMADAEIVAEGTFRDGDGHPASGQAILYRLADGSHTVRLEGLSTDNGPDLRVRLVRSLDDLGDAVVDLGALKSTRGDQNYEVPSGTDVSAAAGVSVWCRTFSVDFGAAELN